MDSMLTVRYYLVLKDRSAFLWVLKRHGKSNITPTFESRLLNHCAISEERSDLAYYYERK